MNDQKHYDKIIPALGKSAKQFIIDNKYYLDEDIVKSLVAVGFKISTYTLRTHRREWGVKKTGGLDGHIIGESPYQRYIHPLEYTGDSCVLGDLEFPFHNAAFTNRVLEVCQQWGIKHLVMGGDVLHNESLTPFDPNWTEPTQAESVSSKAHDKLITFRDELPKTLQKKFDETLGEIGIQAESAHSGLSREWEIASEQILAFRQVFTSADWVLGNHEGRVLRVMQSPMSPVTLRDMVAPGSEWIRIAPYYYSIITSEGKTFRVTHPKNSSVRPASIAYRLCDIYETNVIQCHNHLCGSAVSASGKYMAIETGHCVDGTRLAYYSQRDTTRPKWALGATIIRGGIAWLLNDINTDWEALKRL